MCGNLDKNPVSKGPRVVDQVGITKLGFSTYQHRGHGAIITSTTYPGGFMHNFSTGGIGDAVCRYPGRNAPLPGYGGQGGASIEMSILYWTGIYLECENGQLTVRATDNEIGIRSLGVPVEGDQAGADGCGS